MVLWLLICAAIIVLWVRSYWWTDQVRWISAGGSRSISTAQGNLTSSFFLSGPTPYPIEQRHGLRYEQEDPHRPFNYLMLLGGNTGDIYTSWKHAGFAWYTTRNPPRGTLHGFAVVPFWSLLALSGILPMWLVLRFTLRRIRRRHQEGLCPTCGYDLRATPRQCPECGREFASS